MTSEERLVVAVALQLLAASAAVAAAGQIAAADAEAPLELPCTVVSASMQEEQPASGLPRRFNLSVERRALRTDPATDAAAQDAIFEAIGVALETMPVPTPSALVANFRYYRIESWTGSNSKLEGELAARSREYTVFAQKL